MTTIRYYHYVKTEFDLHPFMDQQQELTLVKRAQSGDKEALGMLWDALTPKLFGYLVNVTRNKTLAEDLLQVVHFEEEQLRFAIQPMLIYP